MRKINVMVGIRLDVLDIFDAIVGDRNRGPKIQELMKAFNEEHMDKGVKLKEEQFKPGGGK